MTKSELKSIIMECLEEEGVVTESFSEEDATVFESAIVAGVIEESCESLDSLEEGANLDSRAFYKDCKKKYKNHIKDAKMCLRKHDFDGARKALREAKEPIAEAKKCIKDTESNAGSVIFGFFASGLLSMGEILAPYCVSLAGYAGASVGAVAGAGALAILGSIAGIGGAIAVTVKSIIAFIKDLTVFVKELQDDKNNVADKLNGYKQKLIRYCDDLDKNIDKLIKSVDQAEKKYNDR